MIPRGRQGCQGRRAFSLVEVALVVVIVFVGTGMALFGYVNYTRNLALKSTAAKLQTVLGHARALAIDSGAPHQVVVDLDRERFWVDRLGDAPVPKVVPEERAADFVRFHDATIDSTSYSNGRVAITFTPQAENPYFVLHMYREATDPAIGANIYSVRLFPSSADPEFEHANL